jgi:hypothetical protein
VRHDDGGEAQPRWRDPEPGHILRDRDRLMVIATDEELARFRTAHVAR